MKKKKKHYQDGVSFLGVPGTLAELRAVSYFRGHKGVLGKGAREIHSRGMESFLASLSVVEARRYREILESVKLAEGLESESPVPQT